MLSLVPSNHEARPVSQRWVALSSDLRLKPEQSEKINPILRQMSDEIGNLRSLALRETEGILSHGQDRMSPILEPDQRTRLKQIIEGYRQVVREV